MYKWSWFLHWLIDGHCDPFFSSKYLEVQFQWTKRIHFTIIKKTHEIPTSTPTAPQRLAPISVHPTISNIYIYTHTITIVIVISFCYLLLLLLFITDIYYCYYIFIIYCYFLLYMTSYPIKFLYKFRYIPCLSSFFHLWPICDSFASELHRGA